MATYYVATNGSTANNGSEASPWTPNHAAASARNLQPGDTVIFKAGTYNLTSMKIQHSGSAGGGYVTFKSETRGGAKLVCSGTNGGIVTQGVSYVRIEGFDVTSGKTGINISTNCHHIEVVNNISHDNPAQGIFCTKSDFLLIEGNVIYGNNNGSANNSISLLMLTPASGDTTDLTSWRAIVRENICYHNGLTAATTDSGGIMMDSNPVHEPEGANFPQFLYPRLIENNICFENGGPGIIVLEAPLTTVRGNTVWHNGRKSGAGGFTGNITIRSDDVIVVNNVAISDKTRSPDVPAISVPVLSKRFLKPALVYTGIVFKNNLTWNGSDASDCLFSNNGNSVNEPTAGNGNKLGVNPMLVNAPATSSSVHEFSEVDFRPATGSPVLDAGTTANNGMHGVATVVDGLPATDFLGATRISLPSIGAYEFVSASIPTGTMAPDSTVAVYLMVRAAQTDLVGDVALGGNFTTLATRNTAPSMYIADTGSTVQDAFPAVTKTGLDTTQGAILAVFSMKPA